MNIFQQKTTTKNTITEKETFTGLTAGNKWWYYDLPYDQKKEESLKK